MAQTSPSQGKSSLTKWVAVLVVIVVVVGGLAYYLLVSSPAPAKVTVVMPNGVGANMNLNFQPVTITVVIGVNNTVVWISQDTIAHTVLNASAPRVFGSGTALINSGQSFSFTFTTPGTYNYFCNLHPTWMKGTVIVKAHG